MTTAKVTSKYQVVIPKEIRKRAGLKEGQILYVYALDDKILLSPQKKWPDDYIGIGKEIWKNIDVAKYIDEMREDWDR